jgi:hypothetical protein
MLIQLQEIFILDAIELQKHCVKFIVAYHESSFHPLTAYTENHKIGSKGVSVCMIHSFHKEGTRA